MASAQIEAEIEAEDVQAECISSSVCCSLGRLTDMRSLLEKSLLLLLFLSFARWFERLNRSNVCNVLFMFVQFSLYNATKPN